MWSTIDLETVAFAAVFFCFSADLMPVSDSSSRGRLDRRESLPHPVICHAACRNESLLRCFLNRFLATLVGR